MDRILLLEHFVQEHVAPALRKFKRSLVLGSFYIYTYPEAGVNGANGGSW